MDTATTIPLRQCRRTPSTTAVPALPEPSASSTTAARAGGHAGVQRHRVAAQVCRDDVDPGRRGGAQIAEIRPGLGVGQRHVAGGGAQLHAGEAAQVLGGDLAQAQRLPHPARETDQHPEVTGGRAGGHRQRVAQIGRTVGVGRVGAAHGAGQHDRNAAVVGEVQPQRGLFHGVGAVGDDHAVGAVADRGPHRGADPVPIGRRQLGAVDRHQVDDIDVDRPDGQVRAAAGGSAHPVGAGAGRDRAAGGDDDEAAHGAIIPHRHAQGMMGECLTNQQDRLSPRRPGRRGSRRSRAAASTAAPAAVGRGAWCWRSTS